MPFNMSAHDDWLTEVRVWCPEVERIIPGVTIETYVEQREGEPFITVMWMDGSDAGRCVALLHGEAEWWKWREAMDSVYADPRWRPDDEEREATDAVRTWLDEEAHYAGEMTAAGWGDDWAGYCAFKARRRALGDPS